MSWLLDCKRPVMWPRCKPSRLQSFKAKLSRQRLPELLEPTLLQEETILEPIVSWTPEYWDVLTTLMVPPDHGEIGVPPSEPIRRRVSLDWSS